VKQTPVLLPINAPESHTSSSQNQPLDRAALVRKAVQAELSVGDSWPKVTSPDGVVSYVRPREVADAPPLAPIAVEQAASCTDERAGIHVADAETRQ
jgi:hypothetical protein